MKQAKQSSFTLSKEGESVIAKELTRYETKLSCLIPCLYQIQREKGWVPPKAIPWLSQKTDIPEAKIHEVLMFYTLFNKKPVGEFHVQVCTNVSCALAGARELTEDLCENLQVKKDEMRADAKVTVTCVECLGACDRAPVLQINEERFDKMSLQKTLTAVNE